MLYKSYLNLKEDLLVNLFYKPHNLLCCRSDNTVSFPTSEFMSVHGAPSTNFFLFCCKEIKFLHFTLVNHLLCFVQNLCQFLLKKNLLPGNENVWVVSIISEQSSYMFKMCWVGGWYLWWDKRVKYYQRHLSIW